MDRFKILVIDDDKDQIEYLSVLFDALQDEMLDVNYAASPEEGFGILEKQNINLVLTDYVMPGMNGYEVLNRVKQLNPLIDVVVFSGKADIETAVTIMKDGAYDYLLKPVKPDTLASLLLRVKEKQRLVRENRELREELQEHNIQSDTIVAESKKMESVLSMVSRSAKSDVNVLIQGESGTGKELVARAIHYSSLRKDKPFVTVNISALSENLIESELFGHKKGAFTGAAADYSGRFSRADGGTLFIDEVGDIPPAVQVKLLRAIQFGQIEQIGGGDALQVDVRIITATSRDVEALIEDNEFRADFYYRLNVINIHIPPLRERKEDIPPLVDHLIPKFAKQHHLRVKGITREALDILMRYDFPGNIRELENILQRSAVLCDSEYITPKDLAGLPLDLIGSPESIRRSGFNIEDSAGMNYDEIMEQFEAGLILSALEDNENNKSAAARALGIGERRLRYRMEKLGIAESDSTKLSK